MVSCSSIFVFCANRDDRDDDDDEATPDPEVRRDAGHRAFAKLVVVPSCENQFSQVAESDQALGWCGGSTAAPSRAGGW
jgi:hypothetical protein